MLVCMPVLIDSLWLPGPTLPVPVKGHRVSYGCLVKGMSGWQRQRDHGKCDTRVPLTGRDGRCWQLACQPPLGAWQADRRSAALPLWGNKLHLLKLNARHKRTYRWKHLSWLGGRKGGGGVLWWGERWTCPSRLFLPWFFKHTDRKMNKWSDGGRHSSAWQANWTCENGEEGEGVSCCYRDGTTEPVNVCTWVPLSHAALQESSGETSLPRSTRTVVLGNCGRKIRAAAIPTISDNDCAGVAAGSVTVMSLYEGETLGGSCAYRFAIYSSLVPHFHFFSHENICFLPSDPISSFHHRRASVACCRDGMFGKRASIDRPPCVCLMF